MRKPKRVYAWPIFLLAMTGILLILASSRGIQGETAVLIFGEKYEKDLFPTRKEFAVFLAKAANQRLPKTKTPCFKDVSSKDPELSSICFLKKKGVFTGSSKSKFYPNQKVSFSFALQKLCRLNNWTPQKTFSACKKYATETFGIPALSPTTPLSYEKLAVLLSARALRPASPERPPQRGENPDPPSEPASSGEQIPLKVPEEKLPVLSSTPVAEGSIAETFFEHVTLTRPLPNRFYLNEVYVISGNLTDVQSDEVFAFLCIENNCANSTNFIVETSGSYFEIPIHFKRAGNYQLGIIPGRSGQSRVETISVLPKIETPVGGEKAKVLHTVYEKGKTTFIWDGRGLVSRLVIFQGGERRDYVFRHGLTAFSPDPTDFVNFKKGNAAWFVEHDAAQSVIQTITLTTQELRTIKTEDIQIKTLPEVLKNPGDGHINAKALRTLSEKVVITLPNGMVQEMVISENDIPKDTAFTVDVNFPEEGTYIFEINNPLGAAVVNVPIYVGDALPLLPDFFALNKGKLDPTPLANLETAREKLLQLINADRKAQGLLPVSLSPALSEIAQKHSKDMVARNFFAHVNPDGKGPDDRRKAARFPNAIKENLGKAASLELAQAGLMRSPIHRGVIIDPLLTHVGLGIEKDKEGYFFVTQNFSSAPLTQENLFTITENLLQKTDEVRRGKSLPLLNRNQMLANVAENWSKRMAREGFFDIKDAQGATLLAALRGSGISTPIQAFIVKAQETDQLADEVRKQPGLENGTYKDIGIGLGLNDFGELLMTVVYTL